MPVSEDVHMEVTFDLPDERISKEPALCVLVTRYEGGPILNRRPVRVGRKTRPPEAYCLVFRHSAGSNEENRRVGFAVIQAD